MKFLILLTFVVCISMAPALEELRSAGANDVMETCSNDSEQDDEKIYCSCGRNGMKICLVQSSNLTVDDTAWKHLLQHPHVKQMRIVVQASLSFIPRHTFNHLHNLRELEIQRATINELPAHVFKNISALARLRLAENHITSLAKKCFEHLPELEQLSLDNNQLRELPRGAFVDLPSLKRMFISQNNITTVHDRAFEHLRSLKELDLHMNSINVLTRDTFVGLQSLRKLELSYNQIDMLGEETFMETPALEVLLIDNNNIALIDEKAFQGLANLRKLVLKNNQLTTLPPMVFQAVPHVNYLDVSYNYLETLTSNNIEPIMKNLLNNTSYLLFEINRFTCDCRLSWMHRLHNQTNPRMRKQIEDMLCYLNVNQTESSEDVEYEYYDDENPSLSNTRLFLRIPLAELPCSDAGLAADMQEMLRVPPTTPPPPPADVHVQSESNSASGPVFNALRLPIVIYLLYAFARWM